VVPRYWHKTSGAATDPNGKRYRLESVGAERPSADARAIVDEHDRASQALADLPLA
jgi:hypothetical protein